MLKSSFIKDKTKEKRMKAALKQDPFDFDFKNEIPLGKCWVWNLMIVCREEGNRVAKAEGNSPWQSGHSHREVTH